MLTCQKGLPRTPDFAFSYDLPPELHSIILLIYSLFVVYLFPEWNIYKAGILSVLSIMVSPVSGLEPSI